jgi:hypothetical protein
LSRVFVNPISCLEKGDLSFTTKEVEISWR